MIANNIQYQPFLVPITERSGNHSCQDSSSKDNLWKNLPRLSFEDICYHLDKLGVKYDQNNPKDFLVDKLRSYLINDIN